MKWPRRSRAQATKGELSSKVSRTPQTAPPFPADRAAAALATGRTVPVQLGVLQATVLLPEGLGRTAEDETVRDIANATIALLRTAAEQHPDPLAAAPGRP
ncbi:hypothetical protein [Streptomyces clavuligerus]|uniref:hypothetical protein n=1 Tax=Streptomyces clavuligerus TaxID=1901 RepID=UPI0001851622|nr:hypothetical protein [Streptomyces clavuligerus]WDN57646.1 hypothetical protein LL058_31190 [Streptomyces clavuligerus]